MPTRLNLCVQPLAQMVTVHRALQLQDVLGRQRRFQFPDDVILSFFSVSSPDLEHRPAFCFFDCLFVLHHLIDRAELLNLLAIIVDRGVLDLPAIAFPLQLDLFGAVRPLQEIVPKLNI